MVGAGEVLQQTPLAVTIAPPMEVTEPPQMAEVVVMSTTSFVVTVNPTGMTVTVTVAVPVHPSLSVPVTEYMFVDVGDTTILEVVSPVLQLYVLAPDTVSVVLWTSLMVVVPLMLRVTILQEVLNVF